MKAVPTSDAVPDRPRRAVVLVDDPSIVVVESPDTADLGAVYDALELLVKWAVRARNGVRQAKQDAQTGRAAADGAGGDLT